LPSQYFSRGSHTLFRFAGGLFPKKKKTGRGIKKNFRSEKRNIVNKNKKKRALCRKLKKKPYVFSGNPPGEGAGGDVFDFFSKRVGTGGGGGPAFQPSSPPDRGLVGISLKKKRKKPGNFPGSQGGGVNKTTTNHHIGGQVFWLFGLRGLWNPARRGAA